MYSKSCTNHNLIHYLTISVLSGFLILGAIYLTNLESQNVCSNQGIRISSNNSSKVDVLLIVDATTFDAEPTLRSVARNITNFISILKMFTPNARFALARTEDKLIGWGGKYKMRIMFDLAPVENMTRTRTMDLIPRILGSFEIRRDGKERFGQNGIIDAILQTIICKEELGWDPNARQIIYVLTQNEPVVGNETSTPICLTKDYQYYKLNDSHHPSPQMVASAINNSPNMTLIIGTLNLNFGRWIPFTSLIPNSILLDVGFLGEKFLTVFSSALDMVRRGGNPMQNEIDCDGGVCDYDFSNVNYYLEEHLKLNKR